MTARPSPFLDDPRDAASRHVRLAIDRPLEQAVAIHLEQAIHHAAIARESGLREKGGG